MISSETKEKMANFNVNSIMHKYKFCYSDSVDDLDGKLAKCTYTFIIGIVYVY